MMSCLNLDRFPTFQAQIESASSRSYAIGPDYILVDLVYNLLILT